LAERRSGIRVKSQGVVQLVGKFWGCSGGGEPTHLLSLLILDVVGFENGFNDRAERWRLPP
jgi:hypothetical protein